MSQTLQFSPILPFVWLLGLASIAGLAALWAGWHRPIWLGLRLVLISTLFFLALGPERVEAEREFLNDIALLLVDHTLSMRMGERSVIRDQAAAQIRAFADENADLDILEIEIEDSPDGSRVFESLQTGLAQIPADRLAGVVLLSDGIVHDQAILPQISAPFHVLRIGDPDRGDRALKIIEAPRFGIVGQQVQFKIRVDDFGQTSHAIAPITLQVAGEPPLSVNVQTGVDVTVGLPLTRRGANLVEIRAGAAPEELTLINNRIAVDVTGVRERLRVLLVSGEPYAGVRAWRNLLKSDPAVDLVHFTILRPPTKRDPTPLKEMALIAFPTRELFVEKLDSFDLVIFDSYTRRGVLPLLYLENIAKYVENGGALMVAAGPPFAGQGSLAKTFLARVLPARPDDTITNAPFTPTITKLGLRHPVTNALIAQQSDWGRWGRVIGTSGSSGDTILSAGDDKPLLILDRIGQGRVALLLSDQAWLWSRGFEGGGPQFELYRRLAHWLMKEPELEEEALHGRIIDGKLTVTMQTLSDNPPVVKIENPDGQVTSLQLTPIRPGIFSATVPVSANSGLLTLKSGKLLSVAAQGQLNLPELDVLQPDASRFMPLIKDSRGALHILANSKSGFSVRRTRPKDRQAGLGWIGLQQNRISLQSSQTRKPLFAAWIGLLLILLLTSLMWWREGKA